MAAKRIKDLSALGSPLQGADEFMVSDQSANTDNKLTVANLLAALGVASYAVGSLPTASVNAAAFATDGRKVGEGSGSGTGVLVIGDGSQWIAVDSGAAVTS